MEKCSNCYFISSSLRVLTLIWKYSIWTWKHSPQRQGYLGCKMTLDYNMDYLFWTVSARKANWNIWWTTDELETTSGDTSNLPWNNVWSKWCNQCTMSSQEIEDTHTRMSIERIFHFWCILFKLKGRGKTSYNRFCVFSSIIVKFCGHLEINTSSVVAIIEP